jgi:DNA invertase Pin-like site-specific DNA recombinase
MKKYMALARVSSREQEQEGFSLEVQEEGFREYGRQNKAVVDPIFRIAETATKAEERRKFKEMLQFAKKHAQEYDGILFYKIDRAARNLKDLVQLEELESDYGLPFIAITQPFQNTPTGRMARRTLATIAAFTTEQQSLDVRDGIARRVVEGWFPSNPPFGYRNRRIHKRSIVETHPENAFKVRRIFELRAINRLTVAEIATKLFEEGLFYSDSKPRFSESKINAILHDQSYLGYIWFRGAWHPGRHERLADKLTWDQVRISFQEQNYRSHELVYASRLIVCGHCGNVVTGEEKFKETKSGAKSYIYYRCSRYSSSGHPRVRIPEAEFDAQIEQWVRPLTRLSPEVSSWIQMVARSIMSSRYPEEQIQVSETKRLLSLIETQRDKLLSKNLSGAIADERYERQSAEFDEQESVLRRQLVDYEHLDQKIGDAADRAPQVFSLLADDWLKMERRARQLALSALFGGFRLEGRTLVPENRTRLGLFQAG